MGGKRVFFFSRYGFVGGREGMGVGGKESRLLILKQVEKILEDGEGKTLPASTVVAHDPKTGNLWLASIASSFITVCEKI